MVLEEVFKNTLLDEKEGVHYRWRNVIRSMYQNVISNVKYDQNISDSFQCYLGVRRGESLSPFIVLCT